MCLDLGMYPICNVVQATSNCLPRLLFEWLTSAIIHRCGAPSKRCAASEGKGPFLLDVQVVWRPSIGQGRYRKAARWVGTAENFRRRRSVSLLSVGRKREEGVLRIPFEPKQAVGPITWKVPKQDGCEKQHAGIGCCSRPIIGYQGAGGVKPCTTRCSMPGLIPFSVHFRDQCTLSRRK